MAQADPVKDLLDTLRAAGCAKASVRFDGGNLAALDVEFAPEPLSAAPFVDRKGRAIDLDAGMPELGKDPDGDEDEGEPDVSSDAAIEKRNLRRPEKAS